MQFSSFSETLSRQALSNLPIFTRKESILRLLETRFIADNFFQGVAFPTYQRDSSKISGSRQETIQKQGSQILGLNKWDTKVNRIDSLPISSILLSFDKSENLQLFPPSKLKEKTCITQSYIAFRHFCKIEGGVDKLIICVILC